MSKGTPFSISGYQRTLAITVEYRGTNYHGWQRQKGSLSVQECLENALSKIADEPITLFAASRTDAGVHAKKQVASFSLKRSLTNVSSFRLGVNSVLPSDIRVMSCEEKNLTFHANRDAHSKIYRYFIIKKGMQSVFKDEFVWNMPHDLDVVQMEQALNCFKGTHDFSAFRTGEAATKSSTRTLYKVALIDSKEMITLVFEGDGFLRNMVRNMVGAVTEVGRGRLSCDHLSRILLNKTKVNELPCAPAKGLFLWSVKYE